MRVKLKVCEHLIASDIRHSALPIPPMAATQQFVGNYRMYHLIRAGAIYEIWAVRPMSETTAVRHEVAAAGAEVRPRATSPS